MFNFYENKFNSDPIFCVWPRIQIEVEVIFAAMRKEALEVHQAIEELEAIQVYCCYC